MARRKASRGTPIPRPRYRACLEDCLKLDLNHLARRGFIRFGACPQGIAHSHDLSHSALRRSGAIPRSDEPRQAKSRSARRQYSLLAKSSMSPAAPPRFPHSIPTTAPRLGTQIKGAKGKTIGRTCGAGAVSLGQDRAMNLPGTICTGGSRAFTLEAGHISPLGTKM